jgi:hypothetical protein
MIAGQAAVPQPGLTPLQFRNENAVVSLQRNAIEFRLVLHFGPQLSTPCSRGLNVRPRLATKGYKGSPGFYRQLRHHSFFRHL